MKIGTFIRKAKVAMTVLAGLAFVGLVSCNKDFDTRLDFDEHPGDANIQTSSYRVAYIVVEGGVGTIVSQEAREIGAMPHLGQLSTHAMVSWNAVSAANKEFLTSYADLLTGVEYDKHGVAGDGSNNNLEDYPTVFKRLAEHSSMRTALISGDATLEPIVETDEIDNYLLEDDDAAVTAKTVEEVSRAEAGFVMATYSGVRQAGESAGYDSETYLQALTSFDNQLGTIVDAIRNRPNYNSERWLIIVASNQGGAYQLPPAQDDGSIFSDTERNNFVVVHNPQFAYQQIDRLETVDPAWMSSAVRYTGDAGRGTIGADRASIFNLESGKDYTIQLKVKIHSNGRQNQTILSKRSSTDGGQAGWGFMLGQNADGVSRGAFRFKVAGREATSPGDIESEVWHSVIVRVYHEDGEQRATIYRNGVAGGTIRIDDVASSSDEPLRIGHAPGWAASLGTQSHTIADVRIYNVAKSVADIETSYCTTLSTPQSDPYHGNLIGYWPGDDDGTELRDRSGNNLHFDLTGSYTWTSFADRGASLCPTLPDDMERYVLRTVDVPRIIYSWFNFMEIEGFDLDAQVWNPVFTNP